MLLKTLRPQVWLTVATENLVVNQSDRSNVLIRVGNCTQRKEKTTADPSPRFEAAVVKANVSNDGRANMRIQPGGRFVATGVTLKMLITNAYRVSDFGFTEQSRSAFNR
jgi:hypothetical protein